MRTDVSFESAGAVCRGWLYRPEPAPASAPAIVMSHGFSGVKEQGLDGFARAFCEAGFVVLAFDYRFLGASDGQPRGRIIPQEQHDDNRAALAWLSRQPGVDATRIGIWGSSYSGGHALYMGAIDPRVKVIVAQVPAVGNSLRSMRARGDRERLTAHLTMLAADHAARTAGEPGGSLPIVAPEGQPCALRTPDSYAWFVSTGAKDAPNWLNSTSVESLARMAEYWPAVFIELISPKPLLILAAKQDALINIEGVREAFNSAGEPKKLVELDCGHFDLYPGEAFHEPALTHAVDWFKMHL